MTSPAPLDAVSPREEAEDKAVHGHALSIASLTCAAVSVTLGLIVLLGWWLRLEPLMTVVPGHIRMKANAAIAFIAAGGSLALALTAAAQAEVRARLLAQVCGRALAVLTLTCGGLTLIEYALHINLHIDELLFADPIQWPYPGRMAHISVVNFCLAGLALLLLGGGRASQLTAQMAALTVGAAAYVGIVGYLYGVPVFYGAMGYTSMALHTGFGFLVLGFGILAAQPQSWLMRVLCGSESGSWIARRLLPLVVVVPVVLGWIYLRPEVNFGRLRFAMALFAVTLVGASCTTLWFMASFLNQAERERKEVALVRERSAAAVDRSERQLRLVTDRLPVLISYIDGDGRFLRVNRTYEEWLGQPIEALVGQTVVEVLKAEYWTRIRPAWEAALRGETATVETLYPTIRGDRRVQVTYAPDADEQGKVRGVICMVVDVEEHRLAEAALRQSEKLAVVGRMASSISHEINNPLEAVTNLLYLLEGETADQDVGHGYVLQAQQELARVTNIVVQTLRFHRQATHPTRCHVSNLVEQVMALYAGKLANARVMVELRFREESGLLCREGELRQVLANLIGNGVDAMSGGGRLVVRTCSALHRRTGERGAVLTVADTGHGISEGVKTTLFEPFHTTKGAKGSGLGLWITKEIIDRHKGSVRVRSSRAEGASGTVFRVHLPYT